MHINRGIGFLCQTWLAIPRGHRYAYGIHLIPSERVTIAQVLSNSRRVGSCIGMDATILEFPKEMIYTNHVDLCSAPIGWLLYTRDTARSPTDLYR